MPIAGKIGARSITWAKGSKSQGPYPSRPPLGYTTSPAWRRSSGVGEEPRIAWATCASAPPGQPESLVAANVIARANGGGAVVKVPSARRRPALVRSRYL